MSAIQVVDFYITTKWVTAADGYLMPEVIVDYPNVLGDNEVVEMRANLAFPFIMWHVFALPEVYDAIEADPKYGEGAILIAEEMEWNPDGEL